MNRTEEADARCPYMLHIYPQTIVCKGFNDGSKIKTIYDSTEYRNDVLEFYCSRYPNGCPIAQANDDLY